MNDKIAFDKPTADALANLLALLRRDWQIPGIMAALAHERLRRLDPIDVSKAAIRAAADPKNRTPAVIPLDGQHWHEPAEVRTLPQPARFVAPPPLSLAEREAALRAAKAAKATLRAAIANHDFPTQPQDRPKEKAQ